MHSGPGRILIAEDNRILADVMRFNLQKVGFEVIAVENGTVAVEQLKTQAFDLLITDYQMPGLDGEQLCKVVRQDLKLEHMPIVMCSAKGFEINIEQLKSNYGVSKVIFKPFSLREVVEISQSLVESRLICPTA
jgi:CheY-like chemotaxis protein